MLPSKYIEYKPPQLKLQYISHDHPSVTIFIKLVVFMDAKRTINA